MYFYHVLDTKHLICQVSLKSNKAKLSIYTFKNGALSRKNYLKGDLRILFSLVDKPNCYKLHKHITAMTITVIQIVSIRTH